MQAISFKTRKGNTLYKFKMGESEFRELDDTYSGLCFKCGEVRHGDTEPDARKYPCEDCGQNAAYGAQEVLMMGAIEFVDEPEGV